MAAVEMLQGTKILTKQAMHLSKVLVRTESNLHKYCIPKPLFGSQL